MLFPNSSTLSQIFLASFVFSSSIVIYPQCKEINEAMLLRLMRPERGGWGGANQSTWYFCNILEQYLNIGSQIFKEMNGVGWDQCGIKLPKTIQIMIHIHFVWWYQHVSYCWQECWEDSAQDGHRARTMTYGQYHCHHRHCHHRHNHHRHCQHCTSGFLIYARWCSAQEGHLTRTPATCWDNYPGKASSCHRQKHHNHHQHCSWNSKLVLPREYNRNSLESSPIVWPTLIFFRN